MGQIARYLADLPRARELLESVVGRGAKAGEEGWTVSYALFELAIVECVDGDVAGDWGEKRVGRAEAFLDGVFARGAYDIKNR